DDEPLPSNWFLINAAIPSNSILYSLVMPSDFEGTLNFSLPPLRIISIASEGSEEMGSVNLKPNFSPMISSCLKIHVDLYSPKGTKPPALIESFGLGMIFFKLISFTVPSPLQCSHAPLGALNENRFGSGF